MANSTNSRSIFLYSIPRGKADQALSAALSYITYYEKPERWEKEKVKYGDFTISESKKGNVCVRLK